MDGHICSKEQFLISGAGIFFIKLIQTMFDRFFIKRSLFFCLQGEGKDAGCIIRR